MSHQRTTKTMTKRLSDADGIDGGLAKFGGRASCGPAAHLLSEVADDLIRMPIYQNVRHVALLVCVCVSLGTNKVV